MHKSPEFVSVRFKSCISPPNLLSRDGCCVRADDQAVSSFVAPITRRILRSESLARSSVSNMTMVKSESMIASWEIRLESDSER